MSIYKVQIEAIHPNYSPKPETWPSDELWFRRETVRTFKVAGETQQEVEALANDMLKAYLEVHGGIASWTSSRWLPELERAAA